MALFESSTQAKYWSLTPEDLISVREQANRQAVQSRPSHPPPLSLEEETIVRRHHERRISRFNRNNNLPDKLAATAITYFKRFFLHRSVMDYNPAAIALLSLYASSKVEEIVFDARDLVARFDASVNGVASDTPLFEQPMSADGCAMRITADALLSTELWFLQQISFHLICYHPFKSLGIAREKLHAANICGTGQKAEDLLADVITRAEHIVRRRALLSDLPLSNLPAVIAVAATIVGAKDAGGPDEKQLLSVLIGDNQSLKDKVRDAVEVLQSLSDRTPENEASQVAQLEKKRKLVQKNINDPMSDEFKEMEKEQLRQEDEKELERLKIFQEKLKRRAEAMLGHDAVDVSSKKRKIEA